MEAQEIIIEELESFSSSSAVAIRHLVAQLGSGSQPLSDEDLEGIIHAEDTHLFLARLTSDPEQIVGMFTLIVYRIPYKKKGWVEDVVVDESYRRQGIAKKMISQAIEEAKKLKVKSLNLTSSPQREYANHLYQNIGFEKYETNVYKISL